MKKIAAYYHIPKSSIVSFADNVNPLGFPNSVLEDLKEKIHLITTYPDPQYEALKASISDYLSISKEMIVLGNGSTQLISLFLQLFAKKQALILSPSYSEYERELKLAGCQIHSFFLREEEEFQLNMEELKKQLSDSISIFVLCNPNNPTSSILSAVEMEELLQHCAQKNIYVLVDETYIEFADHSYSSMPLVPKFQNLMVIRGISKFFAAPGLRMGYGATSNQTFRDTLKETQNPWSINSLAAYAGEKLFQEKAFISETKSFISSERTRMFQRLSKEKHLKLFFPHANFQLLKINHPNYSAPQCFEEGIRQGLLLRDCSSFPGLHGNFLRFCYRNKEENDALLDFLLSYFR